jgi:hypothetical protein
MHEGVRFFAASSASQIFPPFPERRICRFRDSTFQNFQGNLVLACVQTVLCCNSTGCNMHSVYTGHLGPEPKRCLAPSSTSSTPPPTHPTKQSLATYSFVTASIHLVFRCSFSFASSLYRSSRFFAY